jgi:hypothetical protein
MGFRATAQLLFLLSLLLEFISISLPQTLVMVIEQLSFLYPLLLVTSFYFFDIYYDYDIYFIVYIGFISFPTACYQANNQ